MILGDVEETVTTIELDEETFEEIFKVLMVVLAVFIIKKKISSCKFKFCRYFLAVLLKTINSYFVDASAKTISIQRIVLGKWKVLKNSSHTHFLTVLYLYQGLIFYIQVYYLADTSVLLCI